MNVDLSHLRTFLVVAELGSFHAAAKKLHLSQPALSRRIANLEDALGARLFDRTTRRISLTLIGRELTRRTRVLINQVESTLLGIRDLTEGWKTELFIACVPSAVCYFLPAVLAQFYDKFPNVRVHILDEGANDGLSRVIRGEAEFGLNFIGTDESEIDFEPILREPFVLVCRRDNLLARRRKVAWSELSAHRLITVSRSSGSGIRMLLDIALANVPEKLNWFYEVRHISLLPALVAAGLGVAAIPRLAMPKGKNSLLATIPLVEPTVTRTLGLMRKRGRSLSPAAEHLYNLITQFGSESENYGAMSIKNIKK